MHTHTHTLLKHITSGLTVLHGKPVLHEKDKKLLARAAADRAKMAAKLSKKFFFLLGKLDKIEKN